MKKHTYRTVGLQDVRVAEILPLLSEGCLVAIDVAKQRIVVALATSTGDVVKLFRFEHPTETRSFLELVTMLASSVGPGRLKIAMEPTGTYGDALRYQLGTALRLPVIMLSPKRTHDSQAIFDGVSSLHDPKSAVLIAKLCAMQLGNEWQAPEPWRMQLRALVERRRHQREFEERCQGRLEALLARHWPEFGRWLDAREQKSALELLIEFGGPAEVHERKQEARAFLHRASRGRFSAELCDGVVSEAGATLGQPMLSEEREHLSALAREARKALQDAEMLEEKMHELGRSSSAFVALEQWMGTWTAAVLVTLCNPSQYASASQLEKACGLNVREKSSGEHKGRLSITKRGPGLVRQVLYLFALRAIQQRPAVRAWYERRQGYTSESKKRAVIAVMRKLIRAAFHVAKSEPFEEAKLFDLRRLKVDGAQENQAKKRPKQRTQARTIARGTKREREMMSARN